MSRALPERLHGYGVTLARLTADHIEQVRQWRNHPEVARYMLSDAHISAEQQAAWFARVDAAADRAYYVAYLGDEASAFASVTAEDGVALSDADALEAAIYLAPDSRLRGSMLAFAPALTLNDACFATLGCDRLIARVKPDNVGALRFNAHLGYRESGRDDRLIHLQLTRADYDAATARLKQMLSRPRTDNNKPNRQGAS